MGKIETLAAIKSKWKKVYDDKENEKRDYLEKAQAAKERMNKAMEEADKAYKNADMKAYGKAREEQRLCADAVQMYKDKAADIEKEPYITRKEFNEIFNQVKGYFDLIVEDDRENLANIVMEMVDIRDRESAELMEANEFIEFAQLKLLKATNGLYNEKGWLDSLSVKQLSNYEGLNFVRFVCSHDFVNETIKTKAAAKPKRENKA